MLIVTPTEMIDNGRVSFRFLIDAKLDRARCSFPWGFLWKPDKVSLSFNVWQSGSLLVGGGFTKHDSPEWQAEMLEAIPECTLLATNETFEEFEAILKSRGRQYERLCFDGILRTS